jgi:cytosine deaminase
MHTIVRRAQLRGSAQVVDIGIDEGKIVAVDAKLSGDPAVELDAAGGLVVPGFVDGHMHLDKCMLGDVMRPNKSQTLVEAIEITNEHKRHYTVEEIIGRASGVLETAISNGTVAMRGFADVGTVGGLVPVEALLELKQRFADRISLQVCAFPQEGLTRDPGAEDLMREAMRLGADVVGGIPWLEVTDEYVRAHVDFCYELAAEHERDVHFLADDTDDSTSRSLEYLAIRSAEVGYQGRVIASHCGSLAAYDDTHARRVIDLVLAGGVSISSNTHVSLVLGGRSDRGLIRRGTTRTKELIEAGVNVLASQDDVNDPYYPFGRSDQLEVAQYAAHAAHMTYSDELERIFDLITVNAAKALRLEGYGTAVGDRADLVVLGVPSVREALRLLPPRKYVLRAGEIVAGNAIPTT